MTNTNENVKTVPMTDEQLKETRAQLRASLAHTAHGEVANSIENCVAVLEHDPLLKDRIRKNLLTGCVSVFGKLPWTREGDMLCDEDLPFILLHFEKYYSITSEPRILYALKLVANKHAYHPIRDYLNSLKWDGVPRVRYALHHFLGAEVSDFNEECLRVFMLGAVKRVFHPGTKFELMLCLTGGQGAGKSTFLRFLAIKDDWFTDDLRKLDDEKVYLKFMGHWILEMSEMIATVNARSIEEIKSFLSRQKDTYKLPYDKFAADHPRQCVYAGTTNKMDFLPMDRTGNRRFLPIPIDPAKAEVHILDDEAASRAYIKQMWAEIMTIYNSGEYRLCLSKEAEQQRQAVQTAFTQEDTTAGQIYDFMDHYPGDRVCSKLLYKEALDHLFEEPKPWETREICDVVNSGIASGELKGWRAFTSPKRFPKYGTQKGWERVNPNVNAACVNRPPPKRPVGTVFADDEDFSLLDMAS